MSSFNNKSNNQPENSDRANINTNQLRQILLRNSTLGDYFRSDDNIRNKGCVDGIKLQESVLVSVNARMLLN